MSRLALVTMVLSSVLASSASAERRTAAPPSPKTVVRPLSRVLKLNDTQKAHLPTAVKDAAIQKYGLKRIALSNDFLKKHNTDYAVEIPSARAPHRIRNQRASGRCWIYGTDHLLRSALAKQGMSNPPELSTAFINYYSLRDRAFTVLKALALGDSKRKEYNPSIVNLASEGGLQPGALAIIAHRGVVPRSVMHSTADAKSSAIFLDRLQSLLASASQEFRRVGLKPDNGKQRVAVLKQYLGNVDTLLNATLGKPPAQFTIKGKTYTPQSYARDYLGLKPADLDYVYLTNNPTKAFGRRYPVSNPASPKFYAYNVSMKVIEQATKNAIDLGDAVGVNTNVGNPYVATTGEAPKAIKGVMSLKAFNYGALVPEEKLSKRQRMTAGIDLPNHAMTITGYDPKGKGVRKWKVENSWGVRANDRGHLHMYDDYFRQYVGAVIVPRSAVPTDVLKKLESRPAVGEKAPAKQAPAK